MTTTLIENARLFDGKSEACPDGMSVLVENGTIREVSRSQIKSANAHRINAGGRTLMPGLIDVHMHAYISSLDLRKFELAGTPYNTAYAARMLGHMLDCGFTTVRDIGGGDWSLAQALRDGFIRGPRFFYAGKMLSMTGGHGDMRHINVGHHHNHNYCSCPGMNDFVHIADGVDECLKAVREELRRGAHCIKIHGSGGVLSPTDPIWMNQYREDEIRAIVQECTERRTYAAAHCHPASAVKRSVAFGVRSIEHGTLIDEETARFVAEKGAYITPTMAVIYALIEMGKKMGIAPESLAKAEETYKYALSGMDIMRKAGVKIAFGTDLGGEAHTRQCTEFTIRSEVFSPVEILRQATSTGAEVLMQDGKLGCVSPDAHADLLVVDGDPLKDISLLAQDGKKLNLIMRGGEIVKNALN